MIQTEQHPQGRVQPVSLLSGRKRIPLVPASPLGNHGWSRWTGFEDGRQLALEPGMEESVRAVIYRLGVQCSGRGPKQGQPFAGLAPNRRVILRRGPALL